MQKRENNYEGPQRGERKKTSKIILNSKKEFGMRSFVCDVRKESLKFGHPLSPLSTNVQF